MTEPAALDTHRVGSSADGDLRRRIALASQRTGRRRIGLRTRATWLFALLSTLLSVALGTLTFVLVPGGVLERRESVARDSAFNNARLVREVLARETALDADTTGAAQVVDALPSSQLGVTSFLDRDGIWYSPGDGRLRDTDLPTPVVEKVRAGSTVIQRFRAEGTPYVVVGVPLNPSPFAIDSPGADYYEVTSLTDLEETFDTMAVGLLGASAMTLLAAALLGRWASKRVLAPLGEVGEAVHAVASNQLDVRLASANDPDLGPLVDGFNEMVSALKERIERDGRFASDVSHELRSPLTTLTASVAVLQQNREELPEPARQAVDLLAEEFDRFGQLVSDLLEISRFDAGAQQLQRSPLVVGEFLRQAARIACHHPVPVSIADQLDEMVIMADKRRLVQVLSNLADNAEKYANGVTDIRVRRVDNGIELEVVDDGPGVPAGERELIFDRFARGGSAGRRGADQGTGLGLALVAEHIRLHGGTVRVEDRPDGEPGACFVVFLPAEPVSIYDAYEGDEAYDGAGMA